MLLLGGGGLGIAALAGKKAVAASSSSVVAEETSAGVDSSGLLKRQWMEVRGQRTHVWVSAAPAPTAPSVVLVHGLALSGTYMLPTARLLAQDFNVYVPDFAGFGDSAKPETVMDVPALADWLADWMSAAGLERAALLGNSFGCQIILDLAARHPARVERGVLQGPTAPPEERTWIWQAIRWRQNAPNNPPEMGDIADVDYAKTGLVRALMTFEFSLRDTPEDKLPAVAAPMLVVRGGTDPICTQGWAEHVARGLPQGQLTVIPDVAHTLVFTHPAELVAASQSFLAESAATT